MTNNNVRADPKDVRNQGEGACLVWNGFFRARGAEVLQIRTSAFFGQNPSIFFEIYGVFARTKGIQPVWIGGRGQIFPILCGRLVWTALKHEMFS